LLAEITLRHCRKWNKRFRAKKRWGTEVPIGVSSGWPDSHDAGDTGLDPEDDGPAPEEAVIFADFCEAFSKRLTPLQEQILELRLTKRTSNQIVKATNRSQATVSRELSAIRAMLEEEISP
jgi:hypothetical protein